MQEKKCLGKLEEKWKRGRGAKAQRHKGATRQQGHKARRERGNKLVDGILDDLVVNLPGIVVVLFGGFLFPFTDFFGFHFPALIDRCPAPGCTLGDANGFLIYFNEYGIGMAAWKNTDSNPS